MEWLTQIGISAAGLPWWAAFVVIVLTVLCTKGIGALLRYLGFNFEREKYRNGLRKAERDALVEELKGRIETLETEVRETRADLKTASAAHAKCEIEQAKLQGKLDAQAERMNAMQLQINGLLSHDRANKENVKNLAAIVKEEIGKAPTIDQVP